MDKYEREHKTRLAAERLAEDATRRLFDTVRQLEHAKKELEALNATLEGKVLDRTKKLQTALEDIEAFSAAVTHDLKSPLTVLDLKVAVMRRLLDKMDDGSILEPHLQSFDRVSTRMRELVNAIMEYSRANHQMETAKVDMWATVQDVLQLFSDQLEGATVQVDQMPVMEANALQVRQLFQNLIGNAIHYQSPDRPLELRVTYAKTEEHHEIQVKDNGRGFDPAKAEAIFRPFERLNAKESGHGIGLSTCLRIVERHRGTLHAQSHGQGATFIVRLPPTDS